MLEVGRKAGLTLAETILAIGLVAIMSLVIIAVFSKLLTSSAKTADLSSGQSLAQKVLDRAIREGPPDWGTGGALVGVESIYAHDTSKRLDYGYTVTPILLPASSASAMGPVYQVLVRVEWWPDAADASGSRQGSGKLFCELGQLVYPNQ